MARGLFEETRDTTLELVANAAEGYYRVRRSLYDDGSCGRDGAPAGDFIYDYARVSLQYLNELARLGSAYTLLPARMLERLCAATLGPPTGGPCRTPEGVKCAEPGETVKYTSTLKNACSEEQGVRIFVSPFKDGNGNEIGAAPKLSIGGVDYNAGDRIVLPARESKKLSVSIEVPANARQKRIYRARVTAAFEDSDPATIILGLEVQK